MSRWIRWGGFWLVMLLLSSYLPVTAQSSEPPLPVVSEPTAHPRVLITATYLEQTLRPRLREATWETLYQYVTSSQAEADLNANPHQVTKAYALAYLLTGEARFATAGNRGLQMMVQALRARITTGEPWDAQFLDNLAGAAIGYDWLHSTLSAQDRQQITPVLIEAAQYLNDPTRDTGRVYLPTGEDTYRFAAYDHWGLRAIWAVSAVSLALYGEDYRAAALLDYARDLFTGWIIPALETQPGGAWAEGVTYGAQAHWATVQTVTIWWTARGENFFDNTRWWYDRLAYNLFTTYPAVETENTPYWHYTEAIGAGASNPESAALIRAQNLLLGTIYPGSEHATWQAWLDWQANTTLQGWMAVEEFLWHMPSEPVEPPWLLWYTLHTGHAFLRSTWTDSTGNLDQDATVVTFHAGDRFAAEQYYAQGSFTLWRAGSILIPQGGVFAPATDHMANYTMRTVAGNTLLICDLAENFDGIYPNPERDIWLNDCGQRSLVPNTAINPFYKEDNPAYETGTILRYSEEGNIRYFRADLTPAYNSTAYTSPGNRAKVSEVQREFIYLRPGTILIYDRVITTQASFTPINVIHVASPPEERNNWLVVEAGTSQVAIAGIAPQTSDRLVEGYQVAGEEVAPLENDQPAYRLEFTPEQPSTSNFFLTLLIADEQGAALPVWQYVTGESVVGVAWADWQVMFDDDPGNLTGAIFQVQGGVTNVLVTGLVPGGGYRVTLPDGTQVNLLADSAGTLYIFTQMAGELRLQGA